MASVQELSKEDVQPPQAKRLKIESDDDDEVVFGDDGYEDYVNIINYDEVNEDADKEFESFVSQMENSEGFDINFRELKYRYYCRPVRWKQRGLSFQCGELTGGEFMKNLARFAIDKNNLEKGEKLKLVKIVKANWHLCTGQNFYITCVMKDMMDDERLKTYQVEVQVFWDELTVHTFREKPASKDPSVDAANCG